MIRPIQTVLKPYAEAKTLRAIVNDDDVARPVFGKRLAPNPVREPVFDRSQRINRIE